MDENNFLNCFCGEDVPHAVFVAGTPGSGRAALTRRAAAVYCLREDMPERLSVCPHYRELSGETVGVEVVRDLMAQAALQGFNGERRAFLLTEAHRMDQRAQNALLKIFEEPPADTLLLLSGNEEGLLPTVRSRCMVVRLGAKSVADVAEGLLNDGVPRDAAVLAASLSDGLPERAAEMASESYLQFREEAVFLFRRTLFEASPFSDAAMLITATAGEEKSSVEEGGEAIDEEAKRRTKRPDSGRARMLFEVWLSLARDALGYYIGVRECSNLDETTLIGRIAARFTSAQIQGIITMLGTALKSLTAKANTRMILDVTLARLHVKEIAATW